MVLAQLSSEVNLLEEDDAMPNDCSTEMCERLQENDPSLVTLRCPPEFQANDATLGLLGQSLVGNTRLRSLRLQCFATTSTTTTTSSNSLTADGMQKLTHGICQSGVEYLIIEGSCSSELQQQLMQGIQSAYCLKVLSMKKTAVNTSALTDFISVAQQKSLRLTDLGLQKCQMDLEQKRLLSVGLGCHQTLQNLSLHGCGITDDDIEHFVQHWEEASSIQEFDLRDNQLGPRGAQLFVQAVRSHPKMRRMSFSENTRIGFDGITLLAEDLGHCTSLEGICLCYTVETEHNTTPIEVRDETCRVLGQALVRNASLQYLIFAGNGIHPNGAQALMKAVANRPTPMAQLILIGNDTIGYDGLQKIGQELPLVQLEDLYLDSCVDALAKADQTTTTVTTLRWEACQSLANGLRLNHMLKEVDVANNGIDAVGAHCIIRAVAMHPSLTKLSLANNPDIGFHGLELIGKELPNLRLEELKLGKCTPMTTTTSSSSSSPSSSASTNNKKLDPNLVNKAGQALIDGIRSNVHLLELDLHLNQLTEACRDEVDFYLELNNGGRNLMQHQQDMAPTLWCHILANLEDNVDQVYYFLKEQPWLVQPTNNNISSSSSSSTSKKRKASEL